MNQTEYRIKNKIEPSELGESRLLGVIGEKFNNVIYERITGEYARSEVFGEAESAFERCEDDAKAPIGVWQGEFWGKQMLSACRVYRYTGDEKLLAFISESTKRIMSHQREDGYLGTYKNEKQIFRVDPKIGRELMGWDCPWTWNIWCRKYTLWALLEAYEILGDAEILNSAARSVDQLIDMLSGMGARICETGMFYGQPSGSILKPVLVLYRHTGEERYLRFALEIAHQWEDEDTCCTKLITSALAVTPIHEWGFEAARITPKSKYNPCIENRTPVFDVSKTSPETSGKVYEMQSCFDGLLELYRFTGEEKYLKATRSFFELLMQNEYNTLCSVGFNDIFIGAARYQNSISELCDVIHFFRLATELYKITGEVRYIDIAELAFTNCFLAGVTRDGKWGARGVRAAGGHLYVHQQAGFTKNHCCVNNMPRGFANYAETAVMSDFYNVYVNFFSEAQVTLRPFLEEEIKVSIGGGYFTTQEVTLKIDARLYPRPFVKFPAYSNTRRERLLKIRIPEWSKYTTVKAYGETYAVNESGYFTLPLVDGETEINLHFDSTPRLIEGNYNFQFYPLTPYMMQRYISGTELNVDTVIKENHAVLFIGPTLLAASVNLGSTQEEVFGRKTVAGTACSVKAHPHDVPGTACAFDVTFTPSDKSREEFTVTMCDFASASDSEKETEFSVFV